MEVSQPSPQACSRYLLFIALAVLGRQAEADLLLRRYRNNIVQVAQYLQVKQPPELEPIYRGILLRPNEVQGNNVPGKWKTHEYVSFSADADVACWFGTPDSFITPDLYLNDPSISGWIIEYVPVVSEILFHYSWIDVRSGTISNIPGNVYEALIKYLSQREASEAIPQLAWNLKSQQEVSIFPPKGDLDIISRDAFGCSNTQTLDKKLVYRPDWVTIPPEIASMLGVVAGKMPIVDIEYYRQPRSCSQCGSLGLHYMYYLRDNNLVYLPCLSCGRASFGQV